MLYAFHGSDTATALKKARALAGSLRARKPDASLVEMDGDSWTAQSLEGHFGGQGLFSSRYIIFLNRVAGNAEAREELPGFIPAMKESPNIFIILEGKLNAELRRAVDKHADKAVECDLNTEDAKPRDGFNVFAIASAVGRKDSIGAWKAYRQAIDRGIEPENIAGVLFWKAKSMSDKALAGRLAVTYHEAHRGAGDLELGLERVLLGLK